MTKKATKDKRRAIPTFTIAELEDAGRLEPYSYLMDSSDRRLLDEQLVRNPADNATEPADHSRQ